jgi:hypothetical protein
MPLARASGIPARRKLTLSRLPSPGLPAVVVLALFHAAGCRRPMAAPAVTIEREIDPWPARVGPALVTLKLSDAGGGPVSGARVKLEGDMAHPGMKPEFGDTNEIGPGRYQGRLAFTMPGDWVILVHIALPASQYMGQQLEVERQLEVKGVRAN